MSENLVIQSPQKMEVISWEDGYLFAFGSIEPSNQFVGVSGKLVCTGTHDIVSTGMLTYYQYSGPSIWHLFFDISDNKITEGYYDLIVTSYDSKLKSINEVVWQESVLRKFYIQRKDCSKAVSADATSLRKALAASFSYSTKKRLTVGDAAGTVLRLSGSFLSNHPPKNVTLTPLNAAGDPTGAAINSINIFTIPVAVDAAVVEAQPPEPTEAEAVGLLWFADFNNLDVPAGNYTLTISCNHFSDDIPATIS